MSILTASTARQQRATLHYALMPGVLGEACAHGDAGNTIRPLQYCVSGNDRTTGACLSCGWCGIGDQCKSRDGARMLCREPESD